MFLIASLNIGAYFRQAVRCLVYEVFISWCRKGGLVYFICSFYVVFYGGAGILGIVNGTSMNKVLLVNFANIVMFGCIFCFAFTEAFFRMKPGLFLLGMSMPVNMFVKSLLQLLVGIINSYIVFVGAGLGYYRVLVGIIPQRDLFIPLVAVPMITALAISICAIICLARVSTKSRHEFISGTVCLMLILTGIVYLKKLAKHLAFSSMVNGFLHKVSRVSMYLWLAIILVSICANIGVVYQQLANKIPPLSNDE